MSQLSIGSRAPDFELRDTNGRLHRLSDALRHGPVALFFFKVSCPTCQYTFPWIQKIFAKSESGAVTFWGVSEDEDADTLEFARQNGIGFALLIDDDPYPVSAAYGLEFVPSIFLVQPDGLIAESAHGFTKAGLNKIAGFEFFTPNDGLPAVRPG